ncbi:phosphatidylserine synthase [Algibacter amylolyticus]|uniref:Phosphatidylserine synthase n=1 Tax=Algibacter amylolyticus TaxID=1608400 RepID=A0A5M7AYI2_9FLAO|nr:CDP-alcohol phosphatidyltransferase family protein [Algibacter amylolyticus]KAA5822423.1 phosphatidylserine synthase [Algibacter amylolyticus]MBB5269142.1 CDP-diacylglycerol--serine O-phosphatidyltransferase [Algibacter amylolyticus]TSJ73573.1 phosphatidylserine synthase [Algibacter amylolyticus]
MKKQIPNALTLLNLLCGCIAVILAVNGNFVAAAIFVFLGVFFDFFDGFAARKLNVQSELGLQLDSLADMVTSGLVPGVIMYKLLILTLDTSVTQDNSWEANTFGIDFNLPILPLLGLLITLASAYRLAKFNIDEDQQTYFKGLPTPANALLIISLPLIIEFQNSDAINSIILNKWFLLGLTFLSCYLLNSGIKLFALKFKTYGFKGNATRYIFIILCAVLLIVLQFAAIPVIIILYILMSVLDNLTSK